MALGPTSQAAIVFYKWLASMLSYKRDVPYIQQNHGMAPLPSELRPATLLHNVRKEIQTTQTTPTNGVH